MPDEPIQDEPDLPDAADANLADAVEDGDDGFTPIVTFFPDPGFDDDSFGYWGFGLSVSYQWDSGLRAAPLAGGARSGSKFWRAHAETTLKIINCAVARASSIPQLPHIETGDPNDVLLSRQISMPSRECFIDGTEMIVVVAQYIYGMQQAQDITQPIFFPNSVMKVDAPLQLNPADFSRLLQGIVNPPGDFSGGSITF